MRMNIIGGAELAIGSGQILRAGQHHEVGRGARHIERIIRRERNEDRAVGAVLADQVDAVVEELAEEREEAVGRRRQAGVGRDVGNEQALWQSGDGLAARGGIGRRREVAKRGDIVSGAENAVRAGERGAGVVGGAVDAVRARQRVVSIAGAELAQLGLLGGERSRIRRGLIGDQIADRARRRVDDQSAGLRVGGSCLRALEDRIGDGRERLQRRAEGVAAGSQVVVRASDFTQSERQSTGGWPASAIWILVRIKSRSRRVSFAVMCLALLLVTQMHAPSVR